MRRFSEYRNNINNWRKRNYINCWHSSEYESEAMWKLYGENKGGGIAIQTTFNMLYNSLPLDFLGDFGLVHYIDFKEYNIGNRVKRFHPFQAPWYKRESYAHEKEFRIIIEDLSDTNSLDCNKNIKVDLNMLIQCVYVSPEANFYYLDLVKKLLKRYNLKCPVVCSELHEVPFF